MANKKRYRLFAWSVYALIFFVLMVFAVLFMTLPGESAASLFDFSHHNAVFFLIRYSVYAITYFKWPKIARYFNEDVSDQVVRSTRRSVGLLIVVYEVFLGINIFSFL